ncbi:hypothetical protein Droror1_Dr00012389 [Drosera rotundifolia]
MESSCSGGDGDDVGGERQRWRRKKEKEKRWRREKAREDLLRLRKENCDVEQLDEFELDDFTVDWVLCVEIWGLVCRDLEFDCARCVVAARRRSGFVVVELQLLEIEMFRYCGNRRRLGCRVGCCKWFAVESLVSIL